MITLFGSLETKENNKLDFFFYFIIIFIINYNNYKIIIIIIIIIFKDTSLYRQYKFERVQTYITCQLSHTLHWCHARGLKTSLQHIKDDFPCLTHTSWKIALFPSHMITGNNENSIKSLPPPSPPPKKRIFQKGAYRWFVQKTLCCLLNSFGKCSKVLGTSSNILDHVQKSQENIGHQKSPVGSFWWKSQSWKLDKNLIHSTQKKLPNYYYYYSFPQENCLPDGRCTFLWFLPIEKHFL